MESVVSLTFPLASIVIVLFLLWNDLLRRRRTHRVILFARAFLCLGLAVVLVYNWTTFRSQIEELPVHFVLVAALISTIAAAWFVYRGIRGDRRVVPPEEDPLPKIFDSSARSDEGESPRSQTE